MPTSQPPVSGDPDDLKAVLGAFEERTEVVNRLGTEVTSLVGEVRALKSAVAHRPPRREIERKRRLMGLSVAVLALALIFGHDQHVEACGPGARTEAVVDRFLDGEDDVEVLRKAAMPKAPFACDAAFPFHAHAATGYPTGGHIVGLLGYATIIGGALVWVLRPTRRTRREEDHEEVEVEKARTDAIR